MKISINTLQFYQDQYHWAGDVAPQGVDVLLEKIGAQLGGIEEVINFGDKYQGVTIARIASCVKHPNADKLNICLIDDGGRTQDVERNADGLVQVVCGAPNVREGLLVAWLPPGSTVPDSYGKDPFVLGARELRGVMSNGMLASARELALSDNHDGILEITLDADETIAPGTPFAEAYHLTGDVVVDIENKMFTHRPDCFGYIGIAREIAGIHGIAFHSPDWYTPDVQLPDVEAEALPLTVTNELPELVRRFDAIALRDVEVKPSPLWLQIDLAKVGLRSINNIVDYTNYYMLLTGQPLHAYDYDKVKALGGGDGATIVVRNPKPGEKIKLLNGKEIEPRAEAIMIATGSALIGIGGVMGGADTEVDEHTKNIIIEAANFDMYSIRRTSMAHGLFTDAVTRFNKGQSPLQNRAVLARIVAEIRTFANGKVASPLIDDNHLPQEVLSRGSVYAPVTVSADFVNARLGTSLSADDMRTLLTNVEFSVDVKDGELTVTAPFWRTDIEIPEDIVEEVGRLYGYDKLPLTLPKRSIAPSVKDEVIELKSAIRQILSKAGASELLTYSFVHGKLLINTGQNPELAFKLSNALSPELQYYRLSLTPSLLDKVHANIKAGHDQFALFELGKVHAKTEMDAEGLPVEFNRLAMVFAANAKAAQKYRGAAYYQAQTYMTYLFEQLGIASMRLLPVDSVDLAGDQAVQQMLAPFEPKHSAAVFDGERVVGVVGEYAAAVRTALKLPDFSAGFEVFVGSLQNGQAQDYMPLSKYPKVEQDICFKVSSDVSYQQLMDCVSAEIARLAPENTYSTLSPVDIYQRQDDAGHKQITVRLSIVSNDRTMRDSEVAGLLDAVAAKVATDLGAQRV